MSEVTKLEIVWYGEVIHVVKESDYDAAQSELAALREELAETKRTAMTEILALNSTLREQAKSLVTISDRELEIAAEDADDLQQRLTAAEQRNSELVELLRGLANAGDWYTSALEFNRDESGHEWFGKIESVLKTTESGASE